MLGSSKSSKRSASVPVGVWEAKRGWDLNKPNPAGLSATGYFDNEGTFHERCVHMQRGGLPNYRPRMLHAGGLDSVVAALLAMVGLRRRKSCEGGIRSEIDRSGKIRSSTRTDVHHSRL